jgi:hypothetical protein
MKHLTYILIFALLFCESCEVGVHKFQGQGKIDSSLRKKIQSLNESLVKSLNTNDEIALKSLMSDKLLEISGSQLGELSKQLSFIFQKNEFHIYDEYYVVNSNTKTAQTIISGTSGDDDYKLRFKGICEENYVSLLVPKKNIQGFILAIIYGKYKNDWKINMLKVGRIEFDNKNSIEHLAEAEIHLNNDHLIDASNSIIIAGECLKPFPFWEYEQESKFDELRTRIDQQLQETYTLPMTIGRVSSLPQIYGVIPQGHPEGFFPLIKYLSKKDLSDTTSLKAENDQLHQIIDYVFKGIKENNKYIIYKAVNKIPDEGEVVKSYGFVKENK